MQQTAHAVNQTFMIIRTKPVLVPGQASATEAQTWAVPSDAQGQRLDNFLLRHLKGVPKTHVYRIIRSGEVRLNGARAQAQSRLGGGDTVRVPPIRVAQRDAPAAVPHQGPELPVLFEDASLLVVDKPAGWAVHGGSGVQWGVLEWLRQHHEAGQALELVHRLDRETSGVLVLAKKRQALQRLQAAFRARSVQKRYVALSHGHWPRAQQVVDVALLKTHSADGQRVVRAVGPETEGAQRSISVVSRIKNFTLREDKVCLLGVNIKTGRTHQIRVHLAHAGHPIAGDDRYGLKGFNQRLEAMGLRRMFLHAQQLTVMHPSHDTAIDLFSPLPKELLSLLPETAQSVLIDGVKN